MAKTGTKKALSVEQEEFVAKKYEGRRSPSSGASITDLGDVRTGDTLFECKGTFGERTGSKPVKSTLVNQMTKVADEAWQEGKEPAIALRYYIPGHVLADSKGYVDFVVRRLCDDVERNGY